MNARSSIRSTPAALAVNSLRLPGPRETIADLKARVDLVEVARDYVVLQHVDRNWWGRCPIHAERTPSFKINPVRQEFYCFGCLAKGDVVDLVAAIEGLDNSLALRRLREIAAGAAPDPDAMAARASRRAALEVQEAVEVTRRRALAAVILCQSEPLTTGSATLAVQYLSERRGITRWQPHTLRWHPECPWGRERVGCIVVPVANIAGDVTGIWRIRPNMEGEIERRGLGSVLGRCARVIDEAELPVIAVAEGIEDALSVWQLSTYPCWATLSTAGMAALELPPAFEEVRIFADADAAGLEAAQALALRMHAEGRRTRIFKPLACKDANDVLLARRAAWRS